VRKGKHPPAAVVLHTLRKDGFTYLASRGNWATLTTKPLSLFDPSLQLNAAASCEDNLCSNSNWGSFLAGARRRADCGPP
jgi:hypothetical protein